MVFSFGVIVAAKPFNGAVDQWLMLPTQFQTIMTFMCAVVGKNARDSPWLTALFEWVIVLSSGALVLLLVLRLVSPEEFDRRFMKLLQSSEATRAINYLKAGSDKQAAAKQFLADASRAGAVASSGAQAAAASAQTQAPKLMSRAGRNVRSFGNAVRTRWRRNGSPEASGRQSPGRGDVGGSTRRAGSDRISRRSLSSRSVDEPFSSLRTLSSRSVDEPLPLGDLEAELERLEPPRTPQQLADVASAAIHARRHGGKIVTL